jgi:hypothetical protein
MRRPQYPRSSGPPPPPLPPETRTVGQLVAETIRLYGRRFWPSLFLGVGPATVVVVAARLDGLEQFLVELLAGAVLIAGAYVGACVLVAGDAFDRRRLPVAAAVAVLAYLPVPVLARAFLVPAAVWLAFVGLAVPVALLEGTGVRESFRRAVRLARADYVHAFGSLATLAITVFLCQSVLFFLLRDAGDSATAVAAFLANLVISPLLFLGAAMLYHDQAARVGRVRRRRVRARNV